MISSATVLWAGGLATGSALPWGNLSCSRISQAQILLHSPSLFPGRHGQVYLVPSVHLGK